MTLRIKKKQGEKKDSPGKKTMNGKICRFQELGPGLTGTLPDRFKKRRSGGEDRGSMQVRCIPWINFFLFQHFTVLNGFMVWVCFPP